MPALRKHLIVLGKSIYCAHSPSPTFNFSHNQYHNQNIPKHVPLWLCAAEILSPEETEIYLEKKKKIK